jgi:hypothetical protein
MAIPPGDRKKIKAPTPTLDVARKVQNEVPPTVGSKLTTEGDQFPITKTRASFHEEEFIKLVRQHGKNVIWRKAMICPRQTDETEQSKLGCSYCGGSGLIYVDPHVISATMMQFDKRTTLYERMSLWQSGEVQVTVEPQFRMGFLDSLELIDPVIPFTETLKKGNRRGRRQTLPAARLVDSARFRIVHVAKMLFVCPGKDTVEVLEEGTHFAISPEGWIEWTATGDAFVPEGSSLSVHYDFHPVYLVTSWTHVTRDDMSGRKTPAGIKSRSISLPVSSKAKLMWLTDEGTNMTPTFDPLVPVPLGVAAKLPER